MFEKPVTLLLDRMEIYLTYRNYSSFPRMLDTICLYYAPFIAIIYYK